MRYWLRLPLLAEPRRNDAVWRWWSRVRALCHYHPLLGVCIELHEEAGKDALAEFQRRWLAEPLRALVLPMAHFRPNARGFPVLSKPLQALVTCVFALNAQVCSAEPRGPFACATRTPQAHAACRARH
jgi:PRMT5 TIM barrel domain